jgi:long-chain acyl-CoA synthetase
LESAVIGARDAKQGELITAQIVPDAEAFMKFAEEQGEQVSEKLIRDKIKIEVDAVNQLLTAYKRIQKFEIREQEFEKTTTHKIKRHLIKAIEN